MKQEELLKALVTELMKMDTLHQEYQDNDTHFVIDSKKEGNTLTIKVELKENKDKKEFEKWCESIPDDLFQETLDKINKKGDISERYESDKYQDVIKEFKKQFNIIVNNRINSYKKLLY